MDSNITQDIFVKSYPCILLVDDDQDLPDVCSYYTDTLSTLGYEFSVSDVSTQGSPGQADLPEFNQVIWFTGSSWLGTLTSDNEAAVGAYLKMELA